MCIRDSKATGRQIKVRLEGGELEFDLWVPRAGNKKSEDPLKSPKRKAATVKKTGSRFEALNAEMEVESEDEDGDVAMNMVFMGQV